MSFKTLDDLPRNLNGKRVLVRVDLNVPTQHGAVSDTTRLRAAVPTITELSDRGAIVLLLSHFGRPEGKKRSDMSTRQLVKPLAELVGRKVAFIEDCMGPIAQTGANSMSAGQIAVLENTRFHAGEEKNDPELARAMAALGECYVNDAFSAAHRAHASTEGITHYLPSFAGRAMAAELIALERALGNPERPVAALVGGAKVSTKLGVLGHLIEKVDHLIIGGGMANTFLAARGVDVGKSLAEHGMASEATAILERAASTRCTIHLPSDVVVAKALEEEAPGIRTCKVDEVQGDEMILDVGPATVAAVGDILKACRTLVWNGPLGAFEVPPFDSATVALADLAAELTVNGSLLSVAGGGDTVAALNKACVAQDFSFVSTAGGAFLEWMEGRQLPGVAALEDCAVTDSPIEVQEARHEPV
ncbi:MAG: phosphoglycerate kinase [Allosphingosinicella sp.]